MRKIKLVLFFGLLFGFCFGMFSSVSAQAEKSIVPPSYQEKFFGQRHYYQVVFDGEGEAAVAAKIKLVNTDEGELKKTEIEIPGKEVRMIRAVQESYQNKKECESWEQNCMKKEDEMCVKYKRECKKWRLYPNPNNPSYYTLDPEKEKLSDSVKYSFNLKEEVKKQGQTSLLLYYKVPKQAKKKWGVYNFTFETAKAPYDISQTRVAVNLADDFLLKGGKSKTDYQPNFSNFKSEASQVKGSSNETLSSFSDQITYAQGYVKKTQGLDPWESFKVQGKYSRSWFSLYRGAILGWSAGALMFLAVLGFLIKRTVKRKRKSLSDREGEKTAADEASGSDSLLPLKVIGAGFGSVVGILVVILISAFVLRNLSHWIGYQVSEFFGLFVVLVASLIVLALFFGPALYMGVKHGISSGIWTGVATISIMVVLLIIAFIFLAVFGGSPGRPQPLMETQGYPQMKAK